MSIKQNAEYLRTLGGPGSGRHKDGSKETHISGKKLRKQEKSAASASSHAAYLATSHAEKENTVAAHQKAMGAHDEASQLNDDIDNKELTKFHKEKSDQHLDRIIELRKKK